MLHLVYRIFLILTLNLPPLIMEASPTPFKVSNYFISGISPINNPIIRYQTNIYTPEFNMNADSVNVPLKRAGRGFEIIRSRQRTDGEGL